MAVAVAGSLLGASNPLEQTMLQQLVPKTIAGQVFTAQTALRFVGGSFGLLLAGVGVELANVELVLIVGSIILAGSAFGGCCRCPLRAKRKR